MDENKNWMQKMMEASVGTYEENGDKADRNKNDRKERLRGIRRGILLAVIVAVAIQLLYSIFLFVLAKRAEGDLQTASSYKEIEQSFNRVLETQRKLVGRADFYERPFEGNGIRINDGLGALMSESTASVSSGEEISWQPAHDSDVSTREYETMQDSVTNVEEQGVAEADQVLADNGYLYVIHRVSLDESLECGSWIYILKQGDDGCEMVSKVHVSSYCSELETKAAAERGLFVSGNTLIYVENQNYTTVIISYDISNPLQPDKTAYIVQTGTYHTSRMINGKLVVISRRLYQDSKIQFDMGYQGNKLYINDKPLEAGDIYMQRDLYAPGFALIGSYTIEDGKCCVTDKKAVAGQTDRVYMCGQNLYIFNEVVAKRFDKSGRTGITKLTLSSEGKLEGQAHRVVDGWLGKGFAVQEKKGQLRVCTSVSHYKTEWKWAKVEVPFTWYMPEHYTSQLKIIAGIAEDSRDMNVYVLDGQLDTVGKLEGICEGDEIESARFAGDCLYIAGQDNRELTQVNLVTPQIPELMDSIRIEGDVIYLHALRNHPDMLFALGKDVAGELVLTLYEAAVGKKMQQIERYPLIQHYSGAIQEYTQILIQETDEGFYLGFSTQNASGLQYPLLYYQKGNGIKSCLRSKCERRLEHWCRGMFFDGRFYVLRDFDLALQIEQYEANSFQKVGEWSSR